MAIWTNAKDTVGAKLDVPVFYLTQLIGLAFGIPPDDLGLNLNQSPIDKVDGLNIYPKPDVPENMEPKQQETVETGGETE